MLTVREVKTKREQKEFLDFPLKLYKGNPYFVPPLYMDEKKIFRPDYVYYDQSEAIYFNAYRDGEMVGRISGILQKASNEKTGEKRIRFTRFDAIDDAEVAKALFDAVEDWGRSLGMEYICGPLGFSDLEREGLLIEGFDKLSTFEEQYSYEYYPRLIDGLGYEKEVDWLESEIRLPSEEVMRETDRIAEMAMKRYKLHFGEAKNTKDWIKKYADMFFDLLDRSYVDIYGTVPFTEGMKKMMIDNFDLIVKQKYVAMLFDENDKPVCLGICFPSIGQALQKSGGHLTPGAIVRFLHARDHAKVLDFGLVGVDPDIKNAGIVACMLSDLYKLFKADNIEHAETNLNLEDNFAIRNLWKRFDAVEHKRRRSYIKKL